MDKNVNSIFLNFTLNTFDFLFFNDFLSLFNSGEKQFTNTGCPSMMTAKTKQTPEPLTDFREQPYQWRP